MSTTNGANAIDLRHVRVFYSDKLAVDDVSIPIYRNQITAFIGPSGCGKSTVLRAINRMNDLIPGARVEGEIVYNGKNLYASNVDPVEVRRRIGMVFQKPNPFPKSIYDNVAYGPRLLGIRDKRTLDEIVECVPTLTEWKVTGGIWAFGFMLLTVAVKVALPVLSGELRHESGEAPDELEASPAE